MIHSCPRQTPHPREAQGTGGAPPGPSPPPLSKCQLPSGSPTSSSFPGCFRKFWPPFLIDRSPVHQRSVQTLGLSPLWAGGSSCSSILTPWISIRKSTPTPPHILLQPLGAGLARNQERQGAPRRLGRRRPSSRSLALAPVHLRFVFIMFEFAPGVPNLRAADQYLQSDQRQHEIKDKAPRTRNALEPS